MLEPMPMVEPLPVAQKIGGRAPDYLCLWLRMRPITMLEPEPKLRPMAESRDLYYA